MKKPKPEQITSFAIQVLGYSVRDRRREVSAIHIHYGLP
jgi:hypothetical protein